MLMLSGCSSTNAIRPKETGLVLSDSFMEARQGLGSR